MMPKHITINFTDNHNPTKTNANTAGFFFSFYILLFSSCSVFHKKAGLTPPPNSVFDKYLLELLYAYIQGFSLDTYRVSGQKGDH